MGGSTRRRSCGTHGVVLTLAFQSMNYDEGEINNRNKVLIQLKIKEVSIPNE